MKITKNTYKILFLLSFIALSGCSKFGSSGWKWSAEHNNYMPHAEHDPYLEFEKHLQISQWAHEDWVAEDWISQYRDPKDLISGLYKADILRDQVLNGERNILVVGPNFYHLSGFDKRRVTHVMDVIYGITKSAPEGSFFLKDWKTGQYIGVHDQYGLRLH